MQVLFNYAIDSRGNVCMKNVLSKPNIIVNQDIETNMNWSQKSTPLHFFANIFAEIRIFKPNFTGLKVVHIYV